MRHDQSTQALPVTPPARPRIPPPVLSVAGEENGTIQRSAVNRALIPAVLTES